MSVTYADIHNYLSEDQMRDLELALSHPQIKILEQLAELRSDWASDWLMDIFNWESSPQGDEYWRQIWRGLCKREKRE